jgi:RND family efflux transporter MFP subunit
MFYFTGCKEKEEPKKEEIRPVKTITTVKMSTSLAQGYPGITKAIKETDISFRVGGAPIVINNIVEGKKVNKGDLIAAIDPSDFKIAVQSAMARYNQAKAESERYQRLYKKGSVSKSDVERKYAIFKEAESALKLAQNNLAYTKVYAPFTGYYGPKYVDIGDVVKAHQPITKLYDLSKIEITTTIPEQLAVQFKHFSKYEVVFDTYPDTVFSASLKEMEKTPTPEGFILHLYLNYDQTSKSKIKISAGMSCRINIRLKEENSDEIIVPTAAVFESPTDNTPSVWIVTKDLTVKKQHVVLDGFAGRDHIKIKSGLKPGQTIVAAGAKRLIEGQKVKILDQNNFNR